MADELRVYAVFFVQLLFELKKYEDLFNAFFYYLDPVLAPCPYLRAYVVYYRNISFFQLFR